MQKFQLHLLGFVEKKESLKLLKLLTYTVKEFFIMMYLIFPQIETFHRNALLVLYLDEGDLWHKQFITWNFLLKHKSNCI